MAADVGSLPTDPGQFDSDARIYFDQAAQAHRFEDQDGAEWEFYPATGKWSKITADSTDALAAWEQQFKQADVDDETTARDTTRKRKAQEEAREEAAKRQKDNTLRRDNLNKAIYITGIPLDADQAEIYTVFSKHGLIDEDWRTDQPRIKMYDDDDGNFKGEALVIYLKPESVAQAIRLLDKTDFRRGKLEKGLINISMAPRTEPAENKEAERRAPLTDRERQKMAAKKAELAKRLNWDSDDEEDDYKPPEYPCDRMIVIKGMFTPEALDKDPEFRSELKTDILDACGEYGKVTAMVIWDAEPEGIVTVRYSTTTSAGAAVDGMDNRDYDGNKIEVRISTERESFKKKSKPEPAAVVKPPE